MPYKGRVHTERFRHRQTSETPGRFDRNEKARERDGTQTRGGGRAREVRVLQQEELRERERETLHRRMGGTRLCT